MLSKHIVPDVIEKWKMTLVDAVEKAIKRGGPEAHVAVKIVALLSLQLGMRSTASRTVRNSVTRITPSQIISYFR